MSNQTDDAPTLQQHVAAPLVLCDERPVGPTMVARGAASEARQPLVGGLFHLTARRADELCGTDCPGPTDDRTAARHSAVGLAMVAVVALLFRLCQADTVFRSLDYADLPFRVAHYWGWWWIAENPYGPIQPLIAKLWALIVTSLGLPMTERLWRAPAAVLGSMTPLLAYVLLRKLRVGRAAAWAAAALLAVAPFTVSADRYSYSSETYGLFFALLTFLAVLRHVEQPSPRRAMTAGLVLAVYLLSHLLIHSVPLAVLYLLVCSRRTRPLLRFARALLTPPALAILLMVAIHANTGQGQIGHLLFKRDVATTGIAGAGDWALHAASLARQFGWVLAPIVVVAIIIGGGTVNPGRAASRHARRFATRTAVADCGGVSRVKRLRLALGTSATAPAAGVFLIWAIAFLAPIVCLQHYYGRMYGYYVQGCTALLCLACAVFDHLLRYRAAKLAAALVITYLAIGTISTVFLDDRLFALTGVKCPIGAATRDPGYKAAGWYVRTHVPPDAVVFTPHEMAGLEYMPAAYYMGRHCLAGENFTRKQMRRVYDAFATRIDAAVVEPAFDAWFSADAAWRCVACVVDGEVVLLRVYARAGLAIPEPAMRLPTRDYNRRFDREFGPRRIPTMLPAPADLPKPSEIQRAAIGITPFSSREHDSKCLLRFGAREDADERRALHAEGVKLSSRRQSAAPPESCPQKLLDPEGVEEAPCEHHADDVESWRAAVEVPVSTLPKGTPREDHLTSLRNPTLTGSNKRVGRPTGGVACALPPATECHTFGVRTSLYCRPEFPGIRATAGGAP